MKDDKSGGYKSLVNVCNQLLDNSDMEFEMKSYPNSMDMVFFVVGTDLKVTIKCSKVIALKIDKESDQEAFYAVLKVDYKELNDLTSVIKIDGPDIYLYIKCNEVAWKVETMTEKELNAFK